MSNTPIEGRATFFDGPMGTTSTTGVISPAPGHPTLIGHFPGGRSYHVEDLPHGGGTRIWASEPGKEGPTSRAPMPAATKAATGDAGASGRECESALIASIQARNKAFWERRNGG